MRLLPASQRILLPTWQSFLLRKRRSRPINSAYFLGGAYRSGAMHRPELLAAQSQELTLFESGHCEASEAERWCWVHEEVAFNHVSRS
mmetsp:Transcript_34707/g.54206  ORF Transcript_34707/g.54206 Transcript_34707/m.54206 type:complete len:88 (+) Transcript_34707:1285-1548(+)